MRLVGPPGDQNILGILDLAYPAVTSLLWATRGFGADDLVAHR